MIIGGDLPKFGGLLGANWAGTLPPIIVGGAGFLCSWAGEGGFAVGGGVISATGTTGALTLLMKAARLSTGESILKRGGRGGRTGAGAETRLVGVTTLVGSLFMSSNASAVSFTTRVTSCSAVFNAGLSSDAQRIAIRLFATARTCVVVLAATFREVVETLF